MPTAVMLPANAHSLRGDEDVLFPSFLVSGGIWLYTETVFFFVGVYILALQFYRRAITVRKAIVWALGFYAAPILTTVAWTFIGRPVFRNPVKAYRNEGVKELDEAIASDPSDRGLRLARALCTGGALPYSRDSDAELITSGEEYYRLMFGDIRNARESICIENYIVRRDQVTRDFIDLLCTKAQEGVKVRIMFDDYGYDGGTKKYLRMLEKAGAEPCLFHNMTRLLFSPKKNWRNHRKTVVIDGRIGYQGGFNIGEEYLGEGDLGKWRDAAVRIEGPQAQQLLRMFADDWEYTTRKSLDDSGLFREIEPAGDTPVQVLPGDSVNYRENLIEAEFTGLSRHAVRRLWIETPYFAPTRPALAELCAAAASGTDVRIIIPDKPDHPHVFWGNRRFAAIVMRYGAKVYEYHGGFVHCKTIVGDGHLCSIGSANYDARSVRLNFECNVLAYSEILGSEMETAFLEDQEKSTEFLPEMYTDRGTVARIKTVLAMLFRNQL